METKPPTQGGRQGAVKCGVCSKTLNLMQRTAFQCKFCGDHFCGPNHMDWSALGHDCPHKKQAKEERTQRDAVRLAKVVHDKVENRI